MTAVLGLAGLWVLLGAVWLAIYPLIISERGVLSHAALELRDLETEKERLIRELHDLELDRATGKLSEDDFRLIEARLKTRAVEVMRQIDAGARLGV